MAGESLLEILMAIAVFAGVVVVFATVFPGGYKLNQTNMRESKVTRLTTAVVDELLTMPFEDLALMQDGAEGGGWPGNATRFSNFPASVDGKEFVRVSGGDLPKVVGVYYLAERALPADAEVKTVQKGITVNVRTASLPTYVDPLGSQFEPVLKIADIDVILYWYETRNRDYVLRNQSVHAARPNNLINQRGY